MKLYAIHACKVDINSYMYTCTTAVMTTLTLTKAPVFLVCLPFITALVRMASQLTL